MKYDYYLHKSGGYAFDYFGGIGRPYKVNIITVLLAKILKYEITPVPKGRPYNERSVYTRATLCRGISRRSYFMKRIREGIYDRI